MVGVMGRLAPLLPRVVVTLLLVAVAAIVGWQLWVYYMDLPWTRDGRVRADVVQVAPDVSGLVAAVMVHDNQVVGKGDVLFQIDKIRFQLALQEAEALVASTQASVDEAVREMNRSLALTTLEISVQTQQQRVAKAQVARASNAQAIAQRDVAKLNLERSTVRATVNGRVTNFSMRPGDYVNAGTPIFAVIDSDSLYVAGYFQETKLASIDLGAKVRVQLMGESQPIDGHVESIAGGISDRELSLNASLLADVTPTFSWVRLAQRIPVRIAIDHVPDGVRLIAGRTASVTVMPRQKQ
jgi:RND family efflux transporter MFP subunit